MAAVWGYQASLSQEEYKKSIAQGTRAIGTRWVLTRKDGGFKARLVVQGCQEDRNQIRSDAPTGSLLSFYLTLAYAAQQGWSLGGFDTASAYLQSEGIARTLLLRMPARHPHQAPSLTKSCGPWGPYMGPAAQVVHGINI